MAQRFSMFVRIRPEGVEDVLRSDSDLENEAMRDSGYMDDDVMELVTLALEPLEGDVDVERS